MSTVTINLNEIPQEKKYLVLALVATVMGYDLDQEEPEQPAKDDPAAAFGPASQAGVIDPRGPHVVIGEPVHIPPPPPPVSASPAPVGASTDNFIMPWDGRIHASSKAKNADGTWRLKRNIDKATVETVTAELRRAMAAPSPGPQLVPLPPPASNVPPPPPPVDTAADVRRQYVELVGRASSATGAGKITTDQVNKCLTALGVDNMVSLGHRLDLVPAACSLIDGIIAGQNA